MPAMAKLLLLNGPNLNLLGTREPEVYGQQTLDDICSALTNEAQTLGHELSCQQSNAEHELVDAIHQAKIDDISFILINPAAYTHTSIALRDALLGVSIPFIELHLSNVHSREEFRSESLLVDIAVGGVFGFGAHSYQLALLAAHNYLQSH